MIMKKQIISWGMMLAAAFTLTNCAEEIENPNQQPEKQGYPYEIVASTVDTKTVNDGMATKWDGNDAINLFHAVAGVQNYGTNDEFTIADVETGRFTGMLTEELEAGKSYDWYALYPYNSNIATPGDRADGFTYIGHSKGLNQTGYDNMASLKETICPLYGVAKAVASSDTPSITMNHLTSVVAIKVTNTTEEPLTITTASLTAEEDIVGSYFIDITKSPVVYKASEGFVKNTAVVNVSEGTALAKGESATLYLAIKPFTAEAGTSLTLSVNDYAKDPKVLTSDVTFHAGKIKTLNFKYDAEVEPEPDQLKVTWDLTKDETSEATESKIAWTSDFAEMYSERASKQTTAANNYYPGNDRTSTRFYTNNTLTISPKTGYAITSVVFSATSTNYATALKNSEWTNASATVNSTAVTVTPTDGKNAMVAKLAGTCGVTSVDVYYIESEGGETPEEPKALESIAVSNQKTEYVVGDEFVKPIVTATYEGGATADVTASATCGGYDMGTAGTQTVTVSYTEGEKTATTTYKIEVVAQQDLPKGITAIKKEAASTDEADFAVTLTDAVVTYVSGKNAYIEDAEAGILVYNENHGLAAGDKLNGTVSGKVKLYSNLREITQIDWTKATKDAGAEIPVTVLTLAELNADGAYDKYENMRIKIVDATVSATKQISQGDQTYALYFKGQSLTGFDPYNIIDVIGYPSKFNDAIQFNVWENAVFKGATKTTITGISDVTVKVGETKAINAKASSGAKVSYVSANPSVATVGEDGKVTGVAEGNTTITVSVPAHNGYPAAEEVCNVTVTAASQGGEEPEQPAGPVIVLNESFSKSTGTMGWSGNAASGTIKYDVTGWVCENQYGAGGSAKFGTGSKKGTATTPAFNIAGDMVLTFKAGAWNGGSEQTTLLLSINNGGTLSVTSVTMQKGSWTEYEVTISGATANSTITFSGKNNSNSRFLLDDVKIVKN